MFEWVEEEGVLGKGRDVVVVNNVVVVVCGDGTGGGGRGIVRRVMLV